MKKPTPVPQDKPLRKETETRQAMLSQTVEQAGDIVFIADHEGVIEYVNPAFETVTGYAKEEALGKTPRILQSGKMPESYYRQLWKTIQAGKTFRAEVIDRKKNGELFHYDQTISPLKDSHGRITHFISTGKDVTERKRAEQEIRLLLQLTQIIAEAENFDSALTQSLRTVCENTGWDFGEVWTPSEDGKRLEPGAPYFCKDAGLESFRSKSKAFTFEPGIGLPGRVWTSGKAAWIPDVTLNGNFPRAAIAGESGLKAAVGIPILDGEAVVAVIEFFMRETRQEDERMVALISAVAAQLGTAFQRKQAQDEIAKLHKEQAALLKLSQALLTGSEPQAMMDLAVNVAAETFRVEFADIALVDEDKQTYSGRAAVGWPPEVLRQAQRIPLIASTGMSYAIRNRAAVVIPDESKEDRFGAPPWVAQMGIASSLIVPMIVGEEAIGGLVVNSRSPRDWSGDEVRLLTLIANETAQALARAWQHAHAVERLERISALHDIDVAIMSQLDLEKRLDILLEKVTERLRVDAAAVALIDPDTHELNYAARRGLNGEFFADGLLKVKEGIVGQVAHNGEAAAIPDVRLEPRFVRRAVAERLGIVSYLAVPLRARGAIIGVLELATRARHEFLPEEIDFFATLAGQAAIALENARLFEEARRRAAQQGALAETAGAILAALQVEALWPTVTTAVRKTLTADRAAVYLYDPATDRVTCPHASGLSDEYVAEINRRFREIPGGRLLADPRPVVIADAQTDPAAGPVRDLAIREGFHSYIVFPLIAPEGPLGALVAYRDLVAPFSPNDIATGQMLAHIAAVALQNARLFEAERAARERAETLQQVGALLTTHLRLDEVFERLFELLARVVTYDSVSIQLMEEDGGMYLAAGWGFPDMDQAKRVVKDVQKMAVDKQRRWTEGRPKVIPDTHADSDWIMAPGVEYIRSWVGAPLLIKGDLIGILNVDSRNAGAYDEAVGETVMAFANQAAISIENARLFEATQRQVEEMTVLNKVASVAAGTVNEDILIEQATQIIGESLFSDDFGVLLLDETAGALRFHPSYRGNWDSESSKNSTIPLGQGVTGRVAASGQPWRVPDVTREPAYLNLGLATTMRSELCVPLMVGRKLIGAINAERTREDAFSEADERLLGTLAGQLATGIERARLFKGLASEQHRVTLLHHLSLELAANHNPEQVARRALQAAADALGVRGNILTLENDGYHIRLLAVTGYDRETVDELNQRLDWNIGRGVTGRVLRTRAAAIVPDVARDADWVAIPGLDDWVNSMVSVPLVAGDVVVGALNLLSEEPDFFKPQDLSLLASIASPVALALRNARLFEDLRQRLNELEILANTSSALRKTQSHSDIRSILLAKAVEGLKANAGVLLLLEHNELKFTAAYGETRVSTGDACPPEASLLWQVLAGGEPLFIPDITQHREIHNSPTCQNLMGDALSCVCVPLQTTTSAIGLVYLNWKKKAAITTDELRLLESIAEIAANAIHRSTLYEQTVRQAQELAQAYDATIEGWSRALDLRDRETEGHTQRVTELTLELAREMGIPEPDLIHMRRGALLHDIGKMGVPDNILRKAGGLSEEEWAIMRQHPQYACEMLSSIAYLQPALDIPWSHHEKWDGAGYPRGLRGEEIPLAARIFAVADVFDALTSDRPYRPAWTKRKALAYIRQQAGRHFDPNVAETFLKMIAKKK